MLLSGWILDLYPSPQGMTLWLIEANHKRPRLIDRFTPSFYVQRRTRAQYHPSELVQPV
jgi:hypothetical protein